MVTTSLLWVLALLGAWNACGMLVRIGSPEPWRRYAWSVFIGTWATLALWLR